MNDGDKLYERVKDLLKNQRLAVLSTHRDGQPYASLVAFAASEDLKSLVFATTRSTRKYDNLRKIPRVALLVDSRSNRDEDFHEAVGVTATGGAEELTGGEKEAFMKIYLEKHPHLRDFVASPSCALIKIHVDTYYFVSRFQKVFELHVKNGSDHPPA
jgi:nitroimidazol reductase NimA-like FMN-containing flavoprotein (pyridoxamine 5'-phosphate oxidase superfamily)